MNSEKRTVERRNNNQIDGPSGMSHVSMLIAGPLPNGGSNIRNPSHLEMTEKGSGVPREARERVDGLRRAPTNMFEGVQFKDTGYNHDRLWKSLFAQVGYENQPPFPRIIPLHRLKDQQYERAMNEFLRENWARIHNEGYDKELFEEWMSTRIQELFLLNLHLIYQRLCSKVLLVPDYASKGAKSNYQKGNMPAVVQLNTFEMDSDTFIRNCSNLIMGVLVNNWIDFYEKHGRQEGKFWNAQVHHVLLSITLLYQIFRDLHAVLLREFAGRDPEFKPEDADQKILKLVKDQVWKQLDKQVRVDTEVYLNQIDTTFAKAFQQELLLSLPQVCKQFYKEKAPDQTIEEVATQVDYFLTNKFLTTLMKQITDQYGPMNIEILQWICPSLSWKEMFQKEIKEEMEKQKNVKPVICSEIRAKQKRFIEQIKEQFLRILNEKGYASENSKKGMNPLQTLKVNLEELIQHMMTSSTGEVPGAEVTAFKTCIEKLAKATQNFPFWKIESELDEAIKLRPNMKPLCFSKFISDQTAGEEELGRIKAVLALLTYFSLMEVDVDQLREDASSLQERALKPQNLWRRNFVLRAFRVFNEPGEAVAHHYLNYIEYLIEAYRMASVKILNDLPCLDRVGAKRTLIDRQNSLLATFDELRQLLDPLRVGGLFEDVLTGRGCSRMVLLLFPGQQEIREKQRLETVHYPYNTVVSIDSGLADEFDANKSRVLGLFHQLLLNMKSLLDSKQTAITEAQIADKSYKSGGMEKGVLDCAYRTLNQYFRAMDQNHFYTSVLNQVEDENRVDWFKLFEGGSLTDLLAFLHFFVSRMNIIQTERDSLKNSLLIIFLQAEAFCHVPGPQSQDKLESLADWTISYFSKGILYRNKYLTLLTLPGFTSQHTLLKALLKAQTNALLDGPDLRPEQFCDIALYSSENVLLVLQEFHNAKDIRSILRGTVYPILGAEVHGPREHRDQLANLNERRQQTQVGIKPVVLDRNDYGQERGESSELERVLAETDLNKDVMYALESDS
jgi:hypothetical protein